MLKSYVNYPNAQVTIHKDQRCVAIQQQRKPGQRVVRLDRASVSRELEKFESKSYRFGSEAAINDVWLEVDFGDTAFERAVVEYVKTLLAAHYTPFNKAAVEVHC